MIPRYTPAPFEELWSAATRFRTWLEVELAACEAMERAGWSPRHGRAHSRRRAGARSRAHRRHRRDGQHDVIAFLTHVEERWGRNARFLHFGMTSSDVLDTSFALLLTRAADLLATRLDALVEALAARVREHRDTPMIGRSHGIHASPPPSGLPWRATWRSSSAVAPGFAPPAPRSPWQDRGAWHLRAPVPRHRADALAALASRPETVATQVVARDRHAAFFSALALLAAAIERLATNVRHWQRTEVGEAEEASAAGRRARAPCPQAQPIASETSAAWRGWCARRWCRARGRGAVARARHLALLVERMIAPDATTTLGSCSSAQPAGERPRGLSRQARRQPELSGALLTEASCSGWWRGQARQEATALIQRAAMAAYQARGLPGAPRRPIPRSSRPSREASPHFCPRLRPAHTGAPSIGRSGRMTGPCAPRAALPLCACRGATWEPAEGAPEIASAGPRQGPDPRADAPSPHPDRLVDQGSG